MSIFYKTPHNRITTTDSCKKFEQTGMLLSYQSCFSSGEFKHEFEMFTLHILLYIGGRDSAVGIATGYGLDD
jgi:hypothetical protein